MAETEEVLDVEIKPFKKKVRPLNITAEEYLEKNGWVKMGEDDFGNTTWEDPVGSDPPSGPVDPNDSSRFREIRIPNRKDPNKVEIIRQLVIRPGKWTYTMEEATRMQRQRDQAAAEKKVGKQLPPTPVKNELGQIMVKE